MTLCHFITRLIRRYTSPPSTQDAQEASKESMWNYDPNRKGRVRRRV